MSEPIPAITTDIPPAATAAALIALIETLHSDPVAAPLAEVPAGFFLNPRGLSIRYSRPEKGVRQLEAARVLLGGTVTEEESYDLGSIGQRLATTWHGFPLDVHVKIPREDEVAELRKQVAELQAAAAVQAVAE